MRQVGSALGIAILGTVLFATLTNGTSRNLTAAFPTANPACIELVATLVDQTAGQILPALKRPEPGSGRGLQRRRGHPAARAGGVLPRPGIPRGAAPDRRADRVGIRGRDPPRRVRGGRLRARRRGAQPAPPRDAQAQRGRARAGACRRGRRGGRRGRRRSRRRPRQPDARLARRTAPSGAVAPARDTLRAMCRSIRQLRRGEDEGHATTGEAQAAALQYVRKVSRVPNAARSPPSCVRRRHRGGRRRDRATAGRRSAPASRTAPTRSPTR